MKNNHPEITKIPVLVNGLSIEFPIRIIRTEWLMNTLLELGSWDHDFVLPIMAELCERGGLDLADYKDCDDCYNAILHEFDVRNAEEK